MVITVSVMLHETTVAPVTKNALTLVLSELRDKAICKI